MGQLEINTTIQAPPEAVFDLITDLTGAAERVSGIDKIEMLTDGPLNVGTRWRETRTMMGQSSTEELEVTAVEPGVGYTAECESCGCRFVSSFHCEAESEGTRLRVSLSWKALGFMAKLMSPLGALTSGAARKALERDLADIKRAAESAHA